MLERRTFLQLAAAGVTVAALPAPAAAGQAIAVPLSELVLRSRAVVLGTPLGGTSRWADRGGARRIVTTVRLRVDDLLDGRIDTAEALVETLGGRVGTIGQVVHGEARLVRGEASVVFLREIETGLHAVTGLAQGHFPLRPDARGVLRLNASPHRADLVETSESASRLLVGRTVAEAATRIHDARLRAR